jgi:septum site-determining protein MinD
MGEVITVTSGKGGVGKSTTTANIAIGLAQSLEGAGKVVAIDFDIGLRNLDMLLGLENRIVYDVIDFMEGKCKNIQQALIQDKKTPNLYFLAASQNADKTILNINKVKALLDELKKDFRYIIIDSPAGIEDGFLHSIYSADRAIVVTTPEISAVRDADRIIGMIDSKTKASEEGREIQKHLIVNRLKPEMVKDGSMLSVDHVLSILDIPLIGVIPDDEAVVASTNRGVPVVLEEKRSLSGAAYLNVTQRLLGNHVEYLDLSKKSPFSKLFGMFKR